MRISCSALGSRRSDDGPGATRVAQVSNAVVRASSSEAEPVDIGLEPVVLGSVAVGLGLEGFGTMQRQRKMETGARRAGLAFDVAAMVVNDFFDDG